MFRVTDNESDKRAGLVIRFLAVALMLLVAANGCRWGDAGPTAGRAHGEDVAKSEVESGPVRLAVEFRPNPARLSDAPTLILTIDYQRGVVVENPPFGESLGDFLIRDFRDELPRAEGQREIRRRVYTLEPMAAGKLEIQPITVAFVDNRPTGDGRRQQISSEALEIEVTTVIDSATPSLDDLQPMEGPLELPRHAWWTWWLGGGVVACALVAAVIVWRARRRVLDQVEPTRSPGELAQLELAQLLSADLRQRDVKLFYVRLTDIVRRYIEGTTGVRAPEQTTGEFLREIGRGGAFSDTERQRLRAFLESADLVKFAAHTPAAADIDESLRRAQAFLDLTTPETAA